MVDPVSQLDVAPDASANPSTNSNSASPSPTAVTSSTTWSARPPSARSISTHTSRNAIALASSQPSIQSSNVSAHAMSQPTSPARAIERARLAHQLNQHNRGFDQSGFPLTGAPRGLATSSPSSPRLLPTYRSTRSLGGSEGTSPSRIKIRNLSHIQSFASEELMARPRFTHQPGSNYSDPSRQYEISAMPVTDIIEMVAGLLTKITTTNDSQYHHLHRPVPQNEDGANLSSQTTSVLAFHGKNVPTITILSYLSRIHKYCPTTYEVFLSLLVYFDRMTEAVNRGPLQSMRREAAQNLAMFTNSPQSTPSTAPSTDTPTAEATPPPSGSGSMAAEDSATQHAYMPGSENVSSGHGDLSQFFVVDSYNIHRLVIAGVTCASKFFSDVFYTNSRYAKVGGLPLTELNHLELQFLLLNDFRLSIPVEELEAYGTMLVEFYAREVVTQQQQHARQLAGSQITGQSGTDGVLMQVQSAVPPSTQATTPS